MACLSFHSADKGAVTRSGGLTGVHGAIRDASSRTSLAATAAVI
jgi:hypothetical protein